MTTTFESYFAGPYQRWLENVGDEKVFSSDLSISRASWDRRAAYLLWVQLGRPGPDAVKTPPSKAMELKTPPQKIADSVSHCSVCGEPQFDSPSGMTCKNGHGGADDADFSADDWDIA